MIKREAIAQTKWTHYMQARIQAGDPYYGNFEPKQTITDKIYWKRFDNKTEQHQIESLVTGMNIGIYHKISDADPRQKPFDCFMSKPANGYFCIWWNLHKKFTVIRIGDFLAEKINSTEKSLSYTKACEIAERIVMV